MEVSSQLHTPYALPPRKMSQVHIEKDNEWVPKPVWETCSNKYVCPTRNRAPDLLSSSPLPVAVPTLIDSCTSPQISAYPPRPIKLFCPLEGEEVISWKKMYIYLAKHRDITD
jgi:hypothetical protein